MTNQNKNKVLFVNNEETIAKMGKRLLSRNGFDVTTMDSSTDALQLFIGNPCHFDAVVTDHSMPDLTGVELTQELLNIRPDIPVVLFCGYSDLIDASWAREIGFREYLIKPLGIDNLASSLKIILADNWACETHASSRVENTA